MPTARDGLSTNAVGGKIYAIGGGPNPLVALSTVEEYDPKTDTWTKKTDMLEKRFFPSTSVVNGKIYVIGGTQAFPAPLPTMEEYTPEGWQFLISPQGKLTTTWASIKNQ
jgi:N-acetylneuraminic acid mutarotase